MFVMEYRMQVWALTRKLQKYLVFPTSVVEDVFFLPLECKRPQFPRYWKGIWKLKNRKKNNQCLLNMATNSFSENIFWLQIMNFDLYFYHRWSFKNSLLEFLFSCWPNNKSEESCYQFQVVSLFLTNIISINLALLNYSQSVLCVALLLHGINYIFYIAITLSIFRKYFLKSVLCI